jgi:FtsP/CotA-like multicopper oxidase with cupredoxin domain
MDRRTLLSVLGLAPFLPGCRGAIADAVASQADAAPDVELALTAAPGEHPLLPGAATRVWRYTGTMAKGPAGTLQPVPGSSLGPVIRLVRGQRVRVRFANRLTEPSIVHWHGLDVPEAADGHPRLAVPAGADYVYDFTVTNRAGTYWYHPHPHMRTAAQAYMGLAGLLIVSDPEEAALDLPRGEGELLCVLQERRLDAGNQLVYPAAASSEMTGMASGGGRGQGRGRGMGMGMGMGGQMELMNGGLGDRMLVNGLVQPTFDVARRTYRVRLLNGSNARIYKLAWSDGEPMTVIGGDGGLLTTPAERAALTLAPGQRAEVWRDLSTLAAGATVQLTSLAFDPASVGRVGMMGETSPVPQGAPLTMMTLRATSAVGPRVPVPQTLSADTFKADASAPVRRVPLTFMMMNWLIDGRTFEMTEAAPVETVDRNSTHIWEFENRANPMGMAMAHPIHMHGRQFRVVGRSGGTANALREGIHDQGWTDTVLVLSGETVRVQVTFSQEPGLYLYHCHILEHEDMGMMRNVRIR